MSTLSPTQVLFVLKALGKAELYQFAEGRPGENFIESFLDEINTPFGNLLTNIAIEYQVDYDGNNLILRNPPTVDQVQRKVQNYGIRIPNSYGQSSIDSIRYIEEFGSNYLNFITQNNLNINDVNWMGITNVDRFLVNTPALTGNDPYINIYLDVQLKNLCTDFDLYGLYPFLNEIGPQIQNRKYIINYVVNRFRPNGEFWISFGFSYLTIQHNGIKYENVNTIRNLIMKLSGIGLYQLAFLLKPEYIKFIYGIDVTKTVYNTIKGLYHLLLKRIKEYERQKNIQVRFGQRFTEFNENLNN